MEHESLEEHSFLQSFYENLTEEQLEFCNATIEIHNQIVRDMVKELEKGINIFRGEKVLKSKNRAKTIKGSLKDVMKGQ